MTEQKADDAATQNSSTVTQVAVVQHNAGIDVEANLSKLEQLSTQAASEGAQLITWPEAFAYLGRHDGKKEILESLNEGGPILALSLIHI